MTPIATTKEQATMQYRKALIGAVAAASLLGSIGVASASHNGHENPDFSPCRSQEDTLRAGYFDAADQSDPRHDLPTIYANGAPGSTEGNLGICGGSGDNIQYLEVGNGADGPYQGHSTTAIVTGTPADDYGTITPGSDYVEIDGDENNPEVGPITQSDGYLSAGLHEDNNETADPSDDSPGVCASGDNNRAFYETQPQQKDCNDEFVTNATGETK